MNIFPNFQDNFNSVSCKKKLRPLIVLLQTITTIVYKDLTLLITGILKYYSNIIVNSIRNEKYLFLFYVKAMRLKMIEVLSRRL
jgi:hypothetical protein